MDTIRPPVRPSRRQIRRHREQERRRHQQEVQRYLLRMRPQVHTEFDRTIGHMRRVDPDDIPHDRDAMLDWLDEVREAFRLCRDDEINDPALLIRDLQEMRRRYPIRRRRHHLDEDGDEEVTREEVLESAPHTSKQHTPQSEGADHMEAREDDRRHADLIELERYRSQTADDRGGERGGNQPYSHMGSLTPVRIRQAKELVNDLGTESDDDPHTGDLMRAVSRIPTREMRRDLKEWLLKRGLHV